VIRQQFSVVLAVTVLVCSYAPLFGQSDDSKAEVANLAPAFLTSAAEHEPSLFESSLARKNEELEQRIARLEMELNRPPVLAQDPLHAIEQELNRQEYGSGGLFGTIEVTFLKPALSGGPAVFASTAGRMLESHYQTGVRYVLGYTNDSGLGFQARYWSFNNNSPFQPPYAPAEFGISVQAADAEFTLSQTMRHWNLGVTGGLRYGKLQYANPPLTVYNPGMAAFEGCGPTTSISGRRNLGNSGFSLFGSVRGSLMIGDIRTASLLVNVPRGTIEDEVMTAFENQLGVAWNTQLPYHMLLEVRTSWESQYWMSTTLSSDYYGIGSNLALMGPSLAVEVRY
jgi:hypothetical protein